MNMDMEIKLEKFEGPMDLLYSLIVKNKIDIYDIPIALITEQYLDYINAMGKYNMENISEFLIMAATLIEIKSRLLLPKEVDENNEEIDPREELVKRLIEYKKFKGIAEEFNIKQKEAGYVYYKESDRELIKEIRKDVPKEISDILKGATGELLFNAFKEVLKRQELRTDKVRSGFNSVSHDEFTLEEKIDYLE
ncbi:MAG: segregation/condensation protein A, partial [Clostridia bacterium]|nr:segregation/condensation protein A [Clostridia bacterium]